MQEGQDCLRSELCGGVRILGGPQAIGHGEEDPVLFRGTADRVCVFTRVTAFRVLKAYLSGGVDIEAAAAAPVHRQPAHS